MNLRQAVVALAVGLLLVFMPAVAASDSTKSANAPAAKTESQASKAASKQTTQKQGAATDKDKAKGAADQNTSSEKAKAGQGATGKAGGGVSGAALGGGKQKSAGSKEPAKPSAAGGQAQSSADKAGQKGEAAPGSGDVDGATYVVRLRELESRVDELKEQIRRSHTRLSLLSESVLESGVGGAEAEIVLRNAMGNAFRITNVLVVLDGAVQYNEGGADAPHLRNKVTPIFNGAIPPGDHTMQVVVKLQGHGYGVFSYLRGYKFERKGTHSFTVRQGKGLRIEVTVWEKGTVTTPLEDRPDVQFSEQSLEDAPELTTEAP